jgi:DNA-3-methyladenine glycosylase II
MSIQLPDNPPDDFRSLTETSYSEGLKFLQRHDRDLARILLKHGTPPMWKRKPGFSTLLQIILEQQVSLASAKAAHRKVYKAANRLDPVHFLRFSDSELKGFGFSRQKISYGRNLARAIVSCELRLKSLQRMGTTAIREELMKIKGIGLWTADIYILMALLRQDTWPGGDLALAIGVQKLKGLRSRPSAEKLERISRKWRPWRSVAARIIWQYYLNGL